jgi:hypothetical protein
VGGDLRREEEIDLILPFFLRPLCDGRAPETYRQGSRPRRVSGKKVEWTEIPLARTASELPFQFKLISLKPQFEYGRITRKAQGLKNKGRSYRQIGKMFGVSDKTVKKAAFPRVQNKGR